MDTSHANDATLALDLPKVESLALERMVPFRIPEIGRFSVELSLGEGGMGAVFLGRDRSNDQLVATKVLTQRLAQDERASSRFAKKARLLSTVDHPSIARLIESNRDGDTMYIALKRYGPSRHQARKLVAQRTRSTIVPIRNCRRNMCRASHQSRRLWLS